jgi:PAS domain S-box-containing protein
MRPPWWRFVPTAASALVIGVSVVVIAGWILNIQVLTSISPHWATMKINSAVCLFLAGLSLWLLREEESPRARQLAGRLCATVVALVALLTLSEYALNADLGIDQLLLRQPVDETGRSLPGQMSPITAVSFLLSALALLGLDWETRYGYRPAFGLALLTALSGLLGAAGYLYGVKALYTVTPYASMSAQTALSFLVLSTGVLFARSGSGALQLLTSSGTGGVMARRLLPFAIGVPLVVGGLSLQGELAGLYSTEFEQAMFVCVNIVILSILIWRTAVRFNRTEAELALANDSVRTSERLLRNTLDSMSEGYGVIGRDWRYRFLNSAGAKQGRVNSQDVVGRRVMDVFPGIEKTRLFEAIQRGMEARTPVRDEEEFTSADGTKRWIAINVSPAADGIAVLSADITERRQAEETANRGRAQLEAVFASSQDGIVVADMAGHFVLVNESFARIRGYDSVEAMSRHLEEVRTVFQLRQPDGRPLSFEEWPLNRILRGESLTHCELRGRRTDTGREWFFSVSGEPVRDEQGQQVFAVMATRDITQSKLDEEALRQLNAHLEHRVVERTAELEMVNRELETFSYSVSHDLRAPLRAITGFAGILRDDHAAVLNGDALRVLGVIQDNAVRMGQLIDDLLEYSRSSRREIAVATVDIASLVAQVVKELQSGPASATEADIAIASLPSARADYSLIRQVWHNLIGNALKYSRTRSHPHVEIGALDTDTESKLHTYFVRDNGVGFDMQYADKLFGVFQRLHTREEFEGTGVGLAIVQRIVHRHGGRIWAESEPGKGATFFFTLPEGGTP